MHDILHRHAQARGYTTERNMALQSDHKVSRARCAGELQNPLEGVNSDFTARLPNVIQVWEGLGRACRLGLPLLSCPGSLRRALIWLLLLG